MARLETPNCRKTSKNFRKKSKFLLQEIHNVQEEIQYFNFFFLNFSTTNLKIVSLVQDRNLLGPNFFDPKLSRLMHLLNFASLKKLFYKNFRR